MTGPTGGAPRETPREGPRLGPGVEFRRIRRILEGHPIRGAGVLQGPGDDACVLSDGVVLTTDLSIEGVHFRLDWISEEEAGFRAAAAGMSDLAAMAADPVGILASVADPGEGGGAEQLMEGVKRLARQVGAALLGGDLTRSPGPLMVDVVSVGRTAAPLLRSGARVGDELWVTGRLGGAAGAAALWIAGRPVPPEMRRAFAEPTPRIAEAKWLVKAGARAGIDLSDGLAGDAGHLAAASGVALLLDPDALPLHPGLDGGPDARELALHGGEDYELLVTAPAGVLGPRVEEFAGRFDLTLSRVGRVIEGEGVHLESSGPEAPRRLARGGYDHFGEGRDS